MKKHFKSYHLLLLFALLLVIVAGCSLVVDMDIVLRDSYYFFPAAHFFWIAETTLLLSWLLYLYSMRLLFSKALVWTHVVLTIACFACIFSDPYLSNAFSDGLAGMPRRYFDFGESFNCFEFFDFFAGPVKVAFIVLACAQIIYLINLCLGLYKKLHNGKP